MASDKAREARISRLSRMAGNIAAGLVAPVPPPNVAPGQWAYSPPRMIEPSEVAAHAVAIAVAIEAEVQRVCAEPEESSDGK